ncbi:8-oxo-dGTP diphosphatase [Friedmanniella luteola]|uniref:8-oxo-dGTP diphosphatase n=2 Tax=Friedmanniella luteola TaxID=546871 RepID=A0A1H1LUR8_9ACTN|nr:8-oxo-dGTP diphosphatase [Friedmanniella luteola]
MLERPVAAGRTTSRTRPRQRPVLAAGALVTREHPTRGTEVVIVHRKRYDDWSLPKGKLEAGESLPACAVREVQEETGVSIRLGSPLDQVTYDRGAGLKRVDWWSGSVVSAVGRAPDHEVDVVSWLPLKAALSRLTFEHDRFLVQQQLTQPVTTPLVIVRHAKAMDRKDWSRKDAARPINSRGRRQARLLIPMLAAYGAERLVSSTSARCISTLMPYAHHRELRVETYGQLSEEEGTSDAKGVARLVTRIRNQAAADHLPTVICVHRPVLPHVLEALDMVPTSLVTGEFLVAHLTGDGEVHALERHRPQA